MQPTLRTSITYILVFASFIVGAIGENVTGAVLENWTVKQQTLLIAAGLFVIGAFIVWQNRLTNVEAILGAPHSLKSPPQQKRHSKRGLVAFVSLYRPRPKNALFENYAQEIGAQLANKGDHATLDLAESNLKPLLAAIDAHKSTLEHVWLVSTEANNQNSGSYPFASLVAQYYTEREDVSAKFYYEDHVISMGNDLSVATETKDVVERIFRHAQNQYGLGAAQIAADFTGCPRSMTLGMFLACLDERRDIQFIGTDYGADARPTGELYPVLYSFETRKHDDA